MFIIQSADLSHIFGCDLERNQTRIIMKGKGPHYPRYSYDIIRTHSLLVYSDITEKKYSRRYKNSFTALYSFHFQSKKRRHNIYRTVHEVSILYESTI